MIKGVTSLLLILLISFSTFARGENDSIPKEQANTEKNHGPTIGLGIGMLKFYGDILDENRGNPLIGNIGYDLHVKQRLNPFLTAKFYVLFGKISGNERSLNRNLNFESKITTGGLALEYNFSHLLPKNKVFSPYLSIGIESIEFNSKTDLFDEFGNEYNYWTDGSIRNLPENSLNAEDAVIIQRDYHFETDLRELNIDNEGRYPERTFAVPFGAGAILHLSDKVDFTIGATMHFSFSDLIDNVTEESGGERIGNQPGNGGNDKFLMSSFAISYQFVKDKEEEEVKTFEDESGDDYSIFANEDEDQDGVNDFIDQSPFTPLGAEVDEFGVPLDDDKDLVPNYKDEELDTRDGAHVTRTGIELTDTMIYEAYQRYMDSTGLYAETISRKITGVTAPKKLKKQYKVQIGAYREAIDAGLVDKFLNIPDVQIEAFGDSLTVINVGNYDNLPEAVKRKVQLNQDGYDAAIVVKKANDGTYESVGDEANNMDVNKVEISNINSQGLLFRIQFGAFSKKVDERTFNGLKNIMVLEADDGLYKYLYAGSFKTIEAAASKKIGLSIDYGVPDAFIVAYRDGQRISLREAGVNFEGEETGVNKVEEKNYEKSNIKFKVQVGLYKNELPNDILSKFLSINGGVDQTSVENDLTRYSSGSFDSFEEAEAHKENLLAKGISGALVIALHKDELIPLDKAKEVIKE